MSPFPGYVLTVFPLYAVPSYFDADPGVQQRRVQHWPHPGRGGVDCCYMFPGILEIGHFNTHQTRILRSNSIILLLTDWYLKRKVCCEAHVNLSKIGETDSRSPAFPDMRCTDSRSWCCHTPVACEAGACCLCTSLWHHHDPAPHARSSRQCQTMHQVCLR